MDRRRTLRRQSPRRRRHPHPRRHRHRPAQSSARRSSSSAPRATTSLPPQQALDWILDLYDSVDDIRAWGQTIVYTVHEKVGHLGIFVSGGVARKEHDEFASNIDLIDVLPPGLYEAVLTPKGEAVDNPDLVTGEWVMRCEARTLDDIRALGGNDLADERKFEAAARASEINLALYRTFAQPAVRAMASPPAAEAMRRMHPLRLSYEMFGPKNPWMAWIATEAERVRGRRAPGECRGNPLVAVQAQVSRQIVEGLDAWRLAMERLSEDTFHAIYGTPALQAALGIDTTSPERPRKAARSKLHDALVERRIEELRAGMSHGGLAEALIRALIWVGMVRNAVDERGFAAITRLRDAHPANKQMSLADFKALVREQYLMLVVDEQTAIRAIPGLMPEPLEARREAFAALRGVLEVKRSPRRRAGRAPAPCRRALRLGPRAGDELQGVLRTETTVAETPTKYERLIAAARDGTPAVTIVAHPCDETSLRGAVEAAAEGLIEPVLVGPETKIRSVAAEHGIDLTGRKIVDAAHSHAAAACAVALIREGKGELLMKGSLHTDELMREVTASATGLRTDRRISHVFVMDVPGHPETLFITDAAINIFPDLDVKRDIVQNAIDLWVGIGMGTPRVAILSAVETVTTKIPSTIDAAALCKMADRGQITGGLLEGPLAFDNAVDPEAARIKGITSPVAGHAQILVVPDLEAGNMLAKNLSFLAHADAAGIVLGARVPIVLTSRADSVRTRLASCAVAALYANARRAKAAVPAA